MAEPHIACRLDGFDHWPNCCGEPIGVGSLRSAASCACFRDVDPVAEFGSRLLTELSHLEKFRRFPSLSAFLMVREAVPGLYRRQERTLRK